MQIVGTYVTFSRLHIICTFLAKKISKSFIILAHIVYIRLGMFEQNLIQTSFYRASIISYLGQMDKPVDNTVNRV